MNEFEKRFQSYSNEELIIITDIKTHEYTEEAIEIAKNVLHSRGITKPTEEMLNEAKNNAIKKQEHLEEVRDISGEKRIIKEFKKGNMFFVANWLFNIILMYSVYSAITGLASMTAKRPNWPSWSLFILEIMFTIAILGIIPIFIFIFNTKRDKNKQLVLGIPVHIFVTYIVSLIFFITLVILPRL